MDRKDKVVGDRADFGKRKSNSIKVVLRGSKQLEYTVGIAVLLEGDAGVGDGGCGSRDNKKERDKESYKKVLYSKVELCH